MNAQKIYSFVINPWVVIGSLGLGFSLGALLPELSLSLAFVGNIYVDLLKMIVLPFMISAIIFSLQRLFREHGMASILGRLVLVFVLFASVAAVLGTLTMVAMRPGENLPQSTLSTFGRLVGSDLASTDTAMSLRNEDAEPPKKGIGDIFLSLVPSNIFAALANGETLKALVFALLFGFAVGHVPPNIADGLTYSLETIYRSCQTLTRWLNYPLPLVLVCMSAEQLAKTGIEPLQAMMQFVLAFGLASLAALALALLVLYKRGHHSLQETLDALREPFALALATRNSTTCMPTMIEVLTNRLGYARSRVELLVPLSVSLLRIGPMLYYVCATLFIAQLYGRSVNPAEIMLVMVVSILAGFASAGMTGLVTVSLTGMACGYLGLPFEAAFILFVAVDPICDMLRTLVMVIGNTAAVSIICPRPLKEA
jgi:Na+/H+-dicarboxylate symporter